MQGDIAIASGADLLINRGAGYIGIGDSASATTSGAYLVGIFDEFDNSDPTHLQAVLNDLEPPSILGLTQNDSLVTEGETTTQFIR